MRARNPGVSGCDRSDRLLDADNVHDLCKIIHQSATRPRSGLEPKTAIPLAFLDGQLNTEMRTAAVSAAVTKYPAPDNSRVLTLLGSGVQADAHL
jgi:hypothetical protein